MDLFPHTEHPHSDCIDASLVSQVIRTRLPVRVSKYRQFADEGDVSIHREWLQVGGTSYHGGASTKGNIVCFTMPNTRPGKMKAIVKLSEILFAFDGTKLPNQKVLSVTC